jgi:hypothetical protein
MGMADDEQMGLAQQEIDTQRRFWYLQGVQRSHYNYSWAMNAALSAISYSWDLVADKVHKDLDNNEIITLGYQISSVVQRLEVYGSFLMSSDTEVWGLDRDNDEPTAELADEVVERYVGVGFSIYKKLVRYPKVWQQVFGCRKQGYLGSITHTYHYVKEQVAKFGKEQAFSSQQRPSQMYLYELLSNSPSTLELVFSQTPSKEFLAGCVCQECNSCCGTGCKCKYQHHAAFYCEEEESDECDQNDHYQCLGCEPECECC